MCFYSNLRLRLSELSSHCGYLGLQKPTDDPQPFLTNCDNMVTSSTLFWLQGIDTHSNYFVHKRGYLFIRTQRHFSKPNDRKYSQKGMDAKAAALVVSRSYSSPPFLPGSLQRRSHFTGMSAETCVIPSSLSERPLFSGEMACIHATWVHAWLCHYPTIWAWVNYFTCLGLSFLL